MQVERVSNIRRGMQLITRIRVGHAKGYALCSVQSGVLDHLERHERAPPRRRLPYTAPVEGAPTS